MPPEWQTVVHDVVQLKRRVDWGIRRDDDTLPERWKVAIECYQQAIEETAQPTGCAFLQPKN